MKVALISPRGPLYKHKKGIWKKSLRYAPLTLTTLASLVPDDLNIEVELYDEGIEDVPLDLGADLIGISAITGTAVRSYELADHYRKQGRTVVLGGVHPTLVPDEAQEHADSVVVGYAERTWPKLLRDFANDRLEKQYHDHDFEFDPDLPHPERHRLKPRDYLTLNTLEATRSCMHACEFCVVNRAWGSKQVQKPVEYVIEDIRQLNGRKMIFLDLNLISDRAYISELWRAMAELDVEWFGLSTVKLAWDEELLDLAARSGCRGLLVGFESLSRTSLLKTFKGFNTLRDFRFIVDKFHEKGIALMGCFVFGLDGDEPDVFERTVEFCNDAHIDLPRFSICTPFPNTALYNRLESEGRILTKDWSLYDGQHVVFEPKNMSVDELSEGASRAWRSVYSYRSIYKRLSGSRLQLAHLIPANIGYRFYANNLDKFYTCGGASL